MKLARISLHVAFGLLLLVGLAGGTVEAASTTAKKSTTTKSSTTAKSSSDPTGAPATPGNLQGYASDGSLQDGTIVEVTDKAANKVGAVSNKNMSQMFGVTVDRSQLSFTVVSDTLPNEVYVATSGTYNILVSTQNGVIKKGDYVTISAVDGIGMKAGTKDQQAYVFGRAAGNFDGKTNAVGTIQLKDTNGSPIPNVKLGLLPVAIDVKPNPSVLSTKTRLPQWLQQTGQQIAQKTVSPVRMYLSIAVTGLTVIVSLVVLYAGIRNAVIAIGRNPLSRKSIFRGLAEVILSGFVILIIGLFAVYLLLKL